MRTITFTQASWATDGATITGQLYRQQLHSATYGGKGIIQPTDLEVRELSTPGTSVRILSGACVIVGDAVAFQGSYFAVNNGQETMPIASTGSGETRSDLIIVQAQDPNYAGSPFTRDPATDRIVVPVVVSNVSPTATTTSEPNAIVLARVDMPASTGTVTQDLITDLRRPLVLTPVFQDSVQIPQGSTDQLTSTSYVDWPSVGTTTVRVPEWATLMDVDVTIRTAITKSTGGSPHNVFGRLRVIIDPAANTGPSSSRWNHEWPSGNSRIVVGHAETYGVVNLQGQKVTLQTQGIIDGGDGGSAFLEADQGTSIIYRVFFRQRPEFNF